MSKKKEEKEKKSSIEILLLELVKDYNLTLEDRAGIIAAAMLEPPFGISEQYSGSLKSILRISMDLHMRLSGANVALQIVTKRTKPWLAASDSDLLAVLGMVRTSKLLKDVKDEAGDPAVTLYKDVKEFMDNINRMKG